MKTLATRRDPGLQGERTALAWTRTALALLVNALLLTRAGLVHRSSPVAVVGAVLLGIALLVAWYGSRRRAQVTSPAQPQAPPARAMLGIAGVALLASLSGLGVIAVR